MLPPQRTQIVALLGDFGMRSYVWCALCGLLCLPVLARADMVINVSKSQQRLSVAVDGKEIYRWPVSTGRPGYDTPDGVFHAKSMNREWFSRQYEMTPMPWSVFFHQGYALHGTLEPRNIGRAVSHGCVRLLPENAEILFGLVREQGLDSTKIVVSDRPLPNLPKGNPALVAKAAPRNGARPADKEPDRATALALRGDRGTGRAQAPLVAAARAIEADEPAVKGDRADLPLPAVVAAQNQAEVSAVKGDREDIKSEPVVVAALPVVAPAKAALPEAAAQDAPRSELAASDAKPSEPVASERKSVEPVPAEIKPLEISKPAPPETVPPQAKSIEPPPEPVPEPAAVQVELPRPVPLEARQVEPLRAETKPDVKVADAAPDEPPQTVMSADTKQADVAPPPPPPPADAKPAEPEDADVPLPQPRHAEPEHRELRSARRAEPDDANARGDDAEVLRQRAAWLRTLAHKYGFNDWSTR
jgi:hypothetical protein